MATSGSVDYSLTRDAIIQAALENIGVMNPGDTTSSATFTDHSAMAAIRLNNMVKEWMGIHDFAPGLKTWTNKRAYLFLQKSEGVYTLGPTTTATGATNKWASSYVSTTISANEAAGQTVITVVDNGAIADGNRIGILLDTGYMQWTTVSGTPTDNGSTIDVTIAVALTSAAAAGNRVYVYATTTQGRRPLHIMHAAIRDTSDKDRLLEPMSLAAYESIISKTTVADPTRYYYEAQLTDGVLYFDSEISDPTDVVRIVYASPTEDFDAAANDADYPQEWFRALSMGLTVDLCGPFKKFEEVAYWKTLRDEALTAARHSNAETCELYFQPGEAG